jgi:23S rRNA pseudouridine1911/1915/1917 synthase
MPFVKNKFNIEKPIMAFLFVMKALNFRQGQAQSHIARGRLWIDGISMVQNNRIISGDIELIYFEASGRGNKPIFENKDFMLFDKPSGVLVHPRTMLTPYSMLDEVRTYGGQNANGCHRIDMETSGLFLASTNKTSETTLKGLFQDRNIRKSYLAWVDGEFKDNLEIDAPIKNRTKDCTIKTKHKVLIDSSGKSAKTSFKPLFYNKELNATLVECFPHTGRTHQIRVHLFHVKHSIIGDPLYGSSYEAGDIYLNGDMTKEQRETETGASRLLLHAYSLIFNYKNNKYILYSKVDFREMEKLIISKDIRKFNR